MPDTIRDYKLRNGFYTKPQDHSTKNLGILITREIKVICFSTSAITIQPFVYYIWIGTLLNIYIVIVTVGSIVFFSSVYISLNHHFVILGIVFQL